VQVEPTKHLLECRRRWVLPVEILWWIETVAVCALIPTPGAGVGLVLAPVFVPVLVSHLRHGRSLGSVGYWFSVAIINVQVLGVMLIPVSGTMSSRDWIIWGCSAVLALALGVGAWLASEVKPERTPI
jgi:hypothetical protein